MCVPKKDSITQGIVVQHGNPNNAASHLSKDDFIGGGITNGNILGAHRDKVLVKTRHLQCHR